MLKSVLKTALGLEGAVVEGVRIEGESIIVSARPRRAVDVQYEMVRMSTGF